MEGAWRSMEKKEKIPWIKKAAEDQKRYEVQYQAVVSDPSTPTLLPPPSSRPPLLTVVALIVSLRLFKCEVALDRMHRIVSGFNSL